MPMRMGTPLPELSGATEWLNGEVKREELIGSPVLVHFWAVSCPICHENMPTVAAWREKFAPQGLKVIAVHSPRQEEDLNVEMVREDAKALGMLEPCAIDNIRTVIEGFQNELWPAYFLFDRAGNMKSRAAGYAGLKMIEGPLTRMMESS